MFLSFFYFLRKGNGPTGRGMEEESKIQESVNYLWVTRGAVFNKRNDELIAVFGFQCA